MSKKENFEQQTISEPTCSHNKVREIELITEGIVISLQELKLAVCGSQIVGLVPLEAMLLTADFYIQKENLFIVGEDQKIRLVGS